MDFEWEPIRRSIREGRFTYGRHTDERRMRLGLSDDDLQQAFGIDARTELLEYYPNDVRGPSCLLLGFAGDRPLHVVCTCRPPCFLITLYQPGLDRWLPGFRERRRR